MKFLKNQLQKFRQKPLEFNEVLSLEHDARERFPQTVIRLSPLQVIGNIQYDNDDLLLNASVSGQITVPSSRSLDPVVRDVDLIINERYIEDEKKLDDFEETEAVFLLENDTLNVDEAILDNIIAELPLQILTPTEEQSDTLPSGNDWHVVSQINFENEKKDRNEAQLDPRLAKLDDFFKE
ncbi:YceD family protein [Leuconostoc palmae]|uniref:YceD family protein n=1 Tax=Leuconostoc palmae TaxID=501487 RepID=UPI001C7D6832|nr:YceD family protein [Leuconostoc palmae]